MQALWLPNFCSGSFSCLECEVRCSELRRVDWSLIHWFGLAWLASAEFDLWNVEMRYVEFRDAELSWVELK